MLAQKSREKHADLLRKITKLEQDIDSEEKFEEYETTKSELLKIYDKYFHGLKKEKCNMWNYKNVNK